MILLLLACSLPGNKMTAAEGAPFELGRVRSSVWLTLPDGAGALVLLSTETADCESLAAGQLESSLGDGAAVVLWLEARDDGFVDTYRAGVSTWNPWYPSDTDADPLRVVIPTVFSGGHRWDDTGQFLVATVTAFDERFARGRASGDLFDLEFRSERCSGAITDQVASDDTGNVLPDTGGGGSDGDGDGYSAAEDCDDSDSNTFPGAPEACNGRDDNCDGQIDEGLLSTWYEDLDGDGFGQPGASVEACEPPAGTVTNANDCDDSDAAVFPGAPELCDARDNDCDGVIDEDATCP